MDQASIAEAAGLLIKARRTGIALEGLPAALTPTTVTEAHAVQDAVTAGLGERVGAWKVNVTAEGETARGSIFASAIYASPARIAAAKMPLLGVEAEIAFRFRTGLPPRQAAYTRDEVTRAVLASAAIEVVDSRYRDYAKLSTFERITDNIINGGFVFAPPVERWQTLDIARLPVTLAIDDEIIVDRIGGQPNNDPLLPVIALVNHLRADRGVAAGIMVTTGSCTGLNFVKPGQCVEARFTGLGAAQVTFTR